jgi:hypothetical protein
VREASGDDGESANMTAASRSVTDLDAYQGATIHESSVPAVDVGLVAARETSARPRVSPEPADRR